VVTIGADTTDASAFGTFVRPGLFSIFALASNSAEIANTYVLAAAKNGTYTDVIGVPY
jgi:hypothetical protein